jgi:hypothetical protein
VQKQIYPQLHSGGHVHPELVSDNLSAGSNLSRLSFIPNYFVIFTQDLTSRGRNDVIVSHLLPPKDEYVVDDGCGDDNFPGPGMAAPQIIQAGRNWRFQISKMFSVITVRNAECLLLNRGMEGSCSASAVRYGVMRTSLIG